MAATPIELKGHQFTLFSVTLESSDLDQLTMQLTAKMSQAPKLLDSAPIAVALADTAVDISPVAIKDAVSQAGFILAGLTGGSKEQKEHARQSGIAILNASTIAAPQNQGKEKAQSSETVQPEQPDEPALTPCKVMRGPIRSGQQVYAKDSDLVILGQVGAGAEVIADGSIHIYGSLRGKAIAGVQGQSQARIYCQSLQAELVSICGTYWLNETLQENGWQQATCIYLADGQLQTTSL